MDARSRVAVADRMSTMAPLAPLEKVLLVLGAQEALTGHKEVELQRGNMMSTGGKRPNHLPGGMHRPAIPLHKACKLLVRRRRKSMAFPVSKSDYRAW